ncbi:hypothetical protein M3Y99_00689300 [Aphelenchoides fujianensis]|nr:hypothetical protein M3Y99_00689300 [Aphelenchoides fujianensis]
MKRYRFYLLGNVVWCYLLHSLLAFTDVTFLFPSFCVVAEPLLPMPVLPDQLRPLVCSIDGVK